MSGNIIRCIKVIFIWSFDFDGTGDYLTVQNLTLVNLDFGTGDFTIETWFIPLSAIILSTNTLTAADSVFGFNSDGI